MADHGMLFVDRLALEIHEGTKLCTRRPITQSNSMPVRFWSDAADGIVGFAELDWDAHLIEPSHGLVPQGCTPCTDRCRGRDYCCMLIDGTPERGGYLHVPGMGGVTRQRVYCRVQPGDTLWVKEVWRVAASAGANHRIAYRAGGREVERQLPAKSKLPKSAGRDVWQSSMIMGRWAARSVRTVVSVAPERLHHLSENEARAEGFGSPGEFAAAWDRVYAARGKGIAMHPWVWVIRFGMVQAPTM